MKVDKQYIARLRECCEVDGVRDGAEAMNDAVISVFAILPDLLTAYEQQAAKVVDMEELLRTARRDIEDLYTDHVMVKEIDGILKNEEA